MKTLIVTRWRASGQSEERWEFGDDSYLEAMDGRNVCVCDDRGTMVAYYGDVLSVRWED